MITKLLLIIWAVNSFIYYPIGNFNDKTTEYLKTASWAKYQANAEQWQTPEKVSEESKYGEYPKDAVDYEIIYQIERKLDGVSRLAVLKKLFWEVNNHLMTNEEKWRNVLINLNQAIYHHLFQQPVYEENIIVSDPLVLLELGNGRCGHFSRIIIDIALANDYDARLVQVAHHVVAEVYWDNKWHLVDIPFIFNFSNQWPSIEELSFQPNEIDYYPPFYANYFFDSESNKIFHEYLNKKWDLINNSSTYFGSEGLEVLNNQISYWYKIAGDWQNDKYYGWQKLTTEYVNIKSLLESRMPNIEQLGFVINRHKIKIQASKAFDPDNDFWKYELYLSDYSRDWTYKEKEDFKKLFDPIPHNLGIYTFDQELEIDLPSPGEYYMTYFAKDNYAKENPQAFYFPSEEIKLEVK